MASLSLNGVTKFWGQLTAVNNLNLSVEAGEFVVFVGPSGCGKSTTLRMIAGLEPLSAGEICIDGKRIDHLQPAERDIAMVFQDYGLYPSMTVYENICFPLKVRKIPTNKQHARIQQAASRVQLTELLDRRPSQLSGGQQQRVALARAMVREPRLFLMDEPLSSLDAQLRLSMRAEIRNLQHQLGTTTIYVTHDQQEAMTLADRVVVINDGVIQQHDTPEAVYRRPANTFVAGFIGSPPMNLVNGYVSGGVFSGSGLRVTGLPQTHTGQVTLGFRASHVRCESGDQPAQNLCASVFAIENLGETTQITVKLNTTNEGDAVNASSPNNANNNTSNADLQQSTTLFENMADTPGVTIRIAVNKPFDELPPALQSLHIGDPVALGIDGADCLLFAKSDGNLIHH